MPPGSLEKSLFKDSRVDKKSLTVKLQLDGRL